MKQGDLRGVDIKICISPQDPHALLGRNTRVRLNISSFVSCDVLGLVPTPLVHSDSTPKARASRYSECCCFLKQLACFCFVCEWQTRLFFKIAARASKSQSVSREKVQIGQ